MEPVADGFAGAAWFAATSAVAYSLWCAARRLFPEDPPFLTVMHIIVAAWGCLVSACFVLGTAGVLSPLPLVSSVVVLAAGIALFVCRTVPAVIVPLGQAHPLPSSGTPIWTTIYIAVASVLTAAILSRAILQFPEDWDTLMYHLPLVDSWLRERSLYAPDCPLWYNAGNLELIALWLAAPFSGDFWAQLANLPVVLLFGIGTLELGRLLGLTPAIRSGTALAAVATEATFRQATSIKNDAAVAALLIAGIVYGFRFALGGRRGDLWLAAASLGLLPGVKYYALGYAVVAWSGLLPLVLWRRGLKAAVTLAGAGAMATLLLAGYWYVRNVVVSGTPVYPLGISESTDRLDTLHPGTWETTLLGNGRIELLLQCLAATADLAGPIYCIAILTLPITVPWLTLKKQTRRDTGLIAMRRTLGVLVCGSLLIFAITPFVVNLTSGGHAIFSRYIVVRFNLPGLVLSVLALSVLLSDATRKLKRMNEMVAVVPASALVMLVILPLKNIVVAVANDWAIVLLIMLDAVLAILLVRHALLFKTFHRRRVFLAVLAGAAMFGVGSEVLARAWHYKFAATYDRMFRTNVFTKLASLNPPQPTVAVLGYRYYPYFGSRREFRVIRPKSLDSAEALLRLLTKEEVGVISLIRTDPTAAARYRDGPEWVRQRPETFMPFGHRGGFDVFWVRTSLPSGLRDADAEPLANR